MNLINELSFLKNGGLIDEEMLQKFCHTLEETKLFKEGDGLKIKNVFTRGMSLKRFETGEVYTDETLKVPINENLTLSSLYMHNNPRATRFMEFNYIKGPVNIRFTIENGIITKYKYEDGINLCLFDERLYLFNTDKITTDERYMLDDAYYNLALHDLEEYINDGGLKPLRIIDAYDKDKASDIIASNILRPNQIVQGLSSI